MLSLSKCSSFIIVSFFINSEMWKCQQPYRRDLLWILWNLRETSLTALMGGRIPLNISSYCRIYLSAGGPLILSLCNTEIWTCRHVSHVMWYIHMRHDSWLIHVSLHLWFFVHSTSQSKSLVSSHEFIVASSKQHLHSKSLSRCH